MSPNNNGWQPIHCAETPANWQRVTFRLKDPDRTRREALAELIGETRKKAGPPHIVVCHEKGEVRVSISAPEKPKPSRLHAPIAPEKEAEWQQKIQAILAVREAVAAQFSGAEIAFDTNHLGQVQAV